jgi:hypothetical protein
LYEYTHPLAEEEKELKTNIGNDMQQPQDDEELPLILDSG